VRGGAHAAHRGLRAVPDRLRQQGVLGLSSYLASVTMENNAKHLRRRSRRGNRQERSGIESAASKRRSSSVVEELHRGERVCIFAFPLSSDVFCIPPMPHLLERDSAMHTAQ
jgi:hypothetical protein